MAGIGGHGECNLRPATEGREQMFGQVLQSPLSHIGAAGFKSWSWGPATQEGHCGSPGWSSPSPALAQCSPRHVGYETVDVSCHSAS